MTKTLSFEVTETPSGVFLLQEIGSEDPSISFQLDPFDRASRILRARSKAASGFIKLGGGAFDPVAVNMDERPHILVVGRPGFGKTTLLDSLVSESEVGARSVVRVDFSDSETDPLKTLLEALTSVNELPAGIDPTIIAIDGLEKVEDERVLEELQAVLATGRSRRVWIFATVTRLEALERQTLVQFGNVVNLDQAFGWGHLLGDAIVPFRF